MDTQTSFGRRRKPLRVQVEYLNLDNIWEFQRGGVAGRAYEFDWALKRSPELAMLVMVPGAEGVEKVGRVVELVGSPRNVDMRVKRVTGVLSQAEANSVTPENSN